MKCQKYFPTKCRTVAWRSKLFCVIVHAIYIGPLTVYPFLADSLAKQGFFMEVRWWVTLLWNKKNHLVQSYYYSRKASRPSTQNSSWMQESPRSIRAGLFIWCVRSHTHTCQWRTPANLSAHAICRTYEKSYSAEKVLFHRIFFFQSFVFVYECHLWIMRYMSIAYRRCWLRRPKLFCVGLQFRFFVEPPKLILYTILNVKFIPFV